MKNKLSSLFIMKPEKKSIHSRLAVSLLLFCASSIHAETEYVDHIVAVVDDAPILNSDLDKAINVAKKTFIASNQPTPDEDTLAAKVFDRLLTRTSQLNIIRKSGQLLSNEVVNTAILDIANKKGFNNLTDFKEFLEQQQPNGYAKLRKQIREELTINELRKQQLGKRVKVSKRDVDYFLLSPESKKLVKYDYGTLHFRVTLPTGISTDTQQSAAMDLASDIKEQLDNGATVVEIIDNTSGQNLFSVQGGDMGMHSETALPSYLKDNILALEVGETTQPIIHTDGIHVVKLHDKQEQTAVNVKQWKVRHILIKPNKIKTLAQAKQNIDDLHQRIQNGESFADLASTYSDDTGSAKKGGSLDWVMPGQMVKEFEEQIINTPTGDVSIPFETQFGWHILTVEDEREKDMGEEYRRKLARETLFKRQSSQAIEDWMQELRSDSYIEILDNRYKS